MGPAARRDQTARRSRARRKQEEETVMTDQSASIGGPAADAASAPGLPPVTGRATWQAELDRLRAREKAHTPEGDGIAAARRAPAAHRLLLHVAHRTPRRRAVRRLHVVRLPGHRAVLPAFPQHHLRGLL